jgi:hypothetical protein
VLQVSADPAAILRKLQESARQFISISMKVQMGFFCFADG